MVFRFWKYFLVFLELFSFKFIKYLAHHSILKFWFHLWNFFCVFGNPFWCTGLDILEENCLKKNITLVNLHKSSYKLFFNRYDKIKYYEIFSFFWDQLKKFFTWKSKFSHLLRIPSDISNTIIPFSHPHCLPNLNKHHRNNKHSYPPIVKNLLRVKKLFLILSIR